MNFILYYCRQIKDSNTCGSFHLVQEKDRHTVGNPDWHNISNNSFEESTVLNPFIKWASIIYDFKNRPENTYDYIPTDIPPSVKAVERAFKRWMKSFIYNTINGNITT